MLGWRRGTRRNAHGNRLRRRLESLAESPPPSPWRCVGVLAVGGLTEIGFVPESDRLLVVSGQGRGLFDATDGTRIARDRIELFENPDSSGASAPAIGPDDGKTVVLAGLHGGGLQRRTADGWSVEVIHLPWPKHVLFLSSGHLPVSNTEGRAWRLADDEPCEFRTAGFSPTGRSLVFATSCDLRMFSRSDGESDSSPRF